MQTLGWLGIARLGLVQAALGSIVVLTTSTLNRVMVVELALPAILPGFLVAVHYAVQLLRPRWGYGSDQGGSRTPWILGGMAVLAVGGTAAAASTALMGSHPLAGTAAAIVSFIVIGIGVGCSGTALLVLLATSVAEHRRAAAATVTWVMMIVGFILTTAIAGRFLEPFSLQRLVVVTATVCAIAFTVSVLAVGRLERRVAATRPAPSPAKTPFREALQEVWAEPRARAMAMFIFVSMLAYSAQDLVLEPFAGAVFGLTPGESTQLTSVQNGGVLLGMLAVAITATLFSKRKLGSMRLWRVGACVGSAVVLLMLGAGGLIGEPLRPALQPTVLTLGFVNGAFAVAAIASMMVLISAGKQRREGVRMGMWGAAQAIAFGLSGLLATACVDLMRLIFDSQALAFALVFSAQSILFIYAANLSVKLEDGRAGHARPDFASSADAVR